MCLRFLVVQPEQLRDHGTLPYGELAPLLEAVEHAGPDTITVPSLPSLAAWALSRAAESDTTVSICGECGLPWISRRAVDYCYRPAPGKTMTCAQLHAHARFAELRTEWNREYRKIYARKLRGSVTEDDWRGWIKDATSLRKNASIVLPYDLWIAHKQPAQSGDRGIPTPIRGLNTAKKNSQRIISELQAETDAAGG